MRIESQVSNGVDQATKAAERNGTASLSLGSGASDTVSSSHVTSPELQSLLTTLGQIPGVRSDVVAAAERKLADGELSSAQTIGRTAAVLLN